MKIKNITLKTTLTVVLACSINGLFWAILPLFGWSHYSLEGAYTSCSVEWQERSFNVISYNVTIFVLVFLVPVVLILVTSIKLAWIVVSLFFLLKFSLIDVFLLFSIFKILRLTIFQKELNR